RIRLTQDMGEPKPGAAATPMGPTRPQVPMPLATAMPFSILKRQVAMGPVMAEARVGGSQIRGFLAMFPICSMLVPRPWAATPPQPFCRDELPGNWSARPCGPGPRRQHAANGERCQISPALAATYPDYGPCRHARPLPPRV